MSDTSPLTDRTVTLPVLPLPAVVLPSTVVTITLSDDAIRLAVQAGRNVGQHHDFYSGLLRHHVTCAFVVFVNTFRRCSI